MRDREGHNRRPATPALFIEPFDALLKGAGVPADFGDVVGSAVQPHSKAPPGGGALLTDSYFKFNRLRMTQPDVLDADLLCSPGCESRPYRPHPSVGASSQPTFSPPAEIGLSSPAAVGRSAGARE